MKNQTLREYSLKLSKAVSEVFNEGSEYYIDFEELRDEYNLAAFLHALANIVPSKVHNTLVEDELDLIAFNHLANKLVFMFSFDED